MTEGARRGFVLFNDTRTGCASCHVPPLYTDRKNHDVGTGRAAGEHKGPSFKGIVEGNSRVKPSIFANVSVVLQPVAPFSNPRSCNVGFLYQAQIRNETASSRSELE